MLIYKDAVWVDVNSAYGENSHPELVIEIEAINNSIFNILSCPIGSRPHLRNYGCNLITYLFEPCDTDTAADIKFSLFQSIGLWEPRIEIDKSRTSVDTLPTEDGFNVNLVYKIKKTLEKGRYQYTARRA